MGAFSTKKYNKSFNFPPKMQKGFLASKRLSNLVVYGPSNVWTIERSNQSLKLWKHSTIQTQSENQTRKLE